MLITLLRGKEGTEDGGQGLLVYKGKTCCKARAPSHRAATTPPRREVKVIIDSLEDGTWAN